MSRLLTFVTCALCLCVSIGCGGDKAASNAVADSGGDDSSAATDDSASAAGEADDSEMAEGAEDDSAEEGGDSMEMEEGIEEDTDGGGDELDMEGADDLDAADEDGDELEMEEMDEDDAAEEGGDELEMEEMDEGDFADEGGDELEMEEMDEGDFADEGGDGVEMEEGIGFEDRGSVRSRPTEKPDAADFAAMAKYSFQMGRDQDAFKYHYAHALSSNDGAGQLFPTIRWVPGLKRPALATRFGVGVKLTAPPNLADYKPIGSKQQVGGAGGGQRRGRRDDGEGGAGEDFAEDAFEDPGIEGESEAEPGVGEDGEEGFGGRGRGRNPGASISKYAGEFSDKVMEGIQSRMQKGHFGAVLKDALTAGGGAFGSVPGDAGDKASSEIRSMMPGVTFLGIGEDRALAATANEQGVDVLVLFRVAVKPNRKTGYIVNDTDLLLIDPQTRARLHTSGKLNNLKVQMDRQNEKADPVERAIEKFFTYVDANLLMTSLPNGLNPKNVLDNRIRPLLKLSHDDPLPALCEIGFWSSRDLLASEHKVIAFGQLLDAASAKQLASDSEEDRKAVVAKMLPEPL